MYLFLVYFISSPDFGVELYVSLL